VISKNKKMNNGRSQAVWSKQTMHVNRSKKLKCRGTKGAFGNSVKNNGLRLRSAQCGGTETWR
jgi:hypothetical protein